MSKADRKTTRDVPSWNAGKRFARSRRIIKALQKGESQLEIALREGVSKQWVHQLAKEVRQAKEADEPIRNTTLHSM